MLYFIYMYSQLVILFVYHQLLVTKTYLRYLQYVSCKVHVVCVL